MFEKWQKWDVGGWRNRSFAWPLYALGMLALLGVLLRPSTAQTGRIKILAQTGGACGTGVAHCTVLNWTASTTTGVTYQVFRGTTSGGESATPLNSSPITGTSYIDPVILTNSQQTFFYYVEAVETSTGFGTLNSVPSAEVSATFPAIPQAPTGPVATPH
jgi:hypothetical protein